MSTSKPQPTLLSLPFELLHQIIDSLVPSSLTTQIALPQTHATTKALLALTRTCKTTSPIALRHLYTHCLFIDSPSRLQCIADTLSPKTARDLREHATSLYLAPFVGETIDDVETIHAVCRLLSRINPVLRRLVIDMPLRGYDEDAEPLLRGFRSELGEAFRKLALLEMFCSVRDELHLRDDESEVGMPAGWGEPVWKNWKKLRTLALYNVDIFWDASATQLFWRSVAKLRSLENLILTRCDGLDDIRFEDMWREVGGDKDREKKLEVVIFDVEAGHRVQLEGVLNIGEKLSVRQVNAPTSYYGDDDPIELCQEWTKRTIMKGEETLES
jgi:hypothetical protein